MSTHIMWFRKDLRLEDNTALIQALSSLSKEDQLLCMFHLDKKQFKHNSKSADYFFSTLFHFKKTAEEKGITIHLLCDDLFTALDNLKDRYPDWTTIYFNLDNRGYGMKRDLTVIPFLESKGIRVVATEDAHLHPATSIVKPDGTPYKKFTPYYKKWITLPKPIYQKINFSSYLKQLIHNAQAFTKGENLLIDLVNNCQTDYSDLVGEDRANQRLNDFTIEQLEDYDKTRDFPNIDGTSRLSNYLSTGSISIRKVWHSCQTMPSSNGKETYLKELAWRDFYHMIYHYNPNQYQEELMEKYKGMTWQTDDILFNQWKNGHTGYPIIDAAMRQLNQTGWMHNRLRMLVASFLTKDLLIDWRLGERYFSEQLIDYDAASNIGGWQWAASTGTDSVPYFRIFNPTTQGEKFDKDGLFIKQYVPELALLPSTLLHEPCKISMAEQEQFNFHIGVDYPAPIVDHKIARSRTLEWFKSF